MFPGRCWLRVSSRVHKPHRGGRAQDMPIAHKQGKGTTSCPEVVRPGPAPGHVTAARLPSPPGRLDWALSDDGTGAQLKSSFWSQFQSIFLETFRLALQPSTNPPSLWWCGGSLQPSGASALNAKDTPLPWRWPCTNSLMSLVNSPCGGICFGKLKGRGCIWLIFCAHMLFFVSSTGSNTTLKGSRIGRPKMCRFGTWIVLSWRQTRPSRFKKTVYSSRNDLKKFS